MTARVEQVLQQYVQGGLSAPVTVMELLIATEDVGAVRSAVASHTELARSIDFNLQGCERIVAMLRSGKDSSEPASSIAAGVAFCQSLFDWSVTQNEECSVALYSLGSPELLAQATDEVVQWMDTKSLLGTNRRALDIGCGIGRLEQGLHGKLGSMLGIDVSEGMVATARRRCAGLSNVELRTCSGRDLIFVPSGSVDLVFSVDVFPYLHQSGPELVDTHFAEAARVLVPSGDLVIFNFSYRDDVAADSTEVSALAQRHGFEVLDAGSSPFTLWNGRAFQLKRLAR